MEVGVAYILFRQSLLNYIRGKIASEEDAKDILQNVFVKISQNVNLIAGKDNIQSWLFKVTRNAVIDYYRVNLSKKSRLADRSIEDYLIEEQVVDTTKNLEECIHTMIELLPSDYKSIIRDSELNGLKQKDLAKKYDMPYPSLRSRVQRGRERLRKLFYDCCHIETDNRGYVMEATPKSKCENSCGSCE